MKLLSASIAVVVVSFLCNGRLLAAPCVTSALDDYLAQGAAGCKVNDVSFFNFQLPVLFSGASPIASDAIVVSPLATPGNPGLSFAVNAPLTANAGELLEILIGFEASTAAGSSIQGNSLELVGQTAVLPDGAITVVEDKCLGGLFATPPTDCSGTSAGLAVFDVGLDSAIADSLAFSPAGALAVVADLVLDGGTAGSAMLPAAGGAILRFATAAQVPEPSAASTLAACVFAFGLAALRRRPLRPPGFEVFARKDAGFPCSTHPLEGGSSMLTRNLIALAVTAALAAPGAVLAANHREAPITAFDHKADITDVYAFRSYDGDSLPKVTIIMGVDPLLEPGNGPNWFPFDPDILYEIKIDNNNDAIEDIVFRFRFATEQRLPKLFTVYAGVPGGAVAPANSPAPVGAGTLVVPPRIASFADASLGQRQTYSVTMVTKSGSTRIANPTGQFFVVPANVGPRTMDYSALFNAGIYDTNVSDVKVFAGTTDDAFWIDLGGAFDTFNTSITPILSAAQDAAKMNFASDYVSGYAVNSIAIEVPVALLTRTGKVEPATSTAATIGIWATTSRPRVTVRRAPLPALNTGNYQQVQRMGNPLINELLVGTGFKDRFSMDKPKNDSQFASFFLDPALARVINALTNGAVAIPKPPRVDLLPVVTYAAPIAAPGTPAGPVADLLRLNTGVPPTPPASASRLGLLGGDAAGFPNGRRVFDDVTDIALRLVVGGVLAGPPFSTSPINSRLGDGVNVNDADYRTSFPYLADAPSGRTRRHVDPGEPGCSPDNPAPCAP